ncbi:MAG: hypothetical protein LC793_24055 [Thermomicrobia bacterium]|nr:hypothetical protein [Thermomicrobia bacterium]
MRAIKTIEQQTAEYIALWEKAPFREIRKEHEDQWFRSHIEFLRAEAARARTDGTTYCDPEDYATQCEAFITMYEAVIAVNERRYRQGR